MSWCAKKISPMLRIGNHMVMLKEKIIALVTQYAKGGAK